MQVQAYLFFHGRCEEALTFYRESLGAEVPVMMRFRDCPDPLPPGMIPDGFDEKIMHAEFRIGDSIVMASDGCTAQAPSFQGFALSISAPDETQARRLFDKLADGGQVQMPLGKTFFSPCFGSVADRYGMNWMVVVPQPT
ncbi:VOC family protein [Noviherbaspirillum aridicola]|uniref:VOC family protein n=1 Tax=Noviherbaspirillum aridicola TaxID=2849687 RepID=A0ABQ4Q028_9BURK|nr:VOC family protein [Noviherbaspirillum aridicola]GIZ50502.1 VOC family protein [Noviherbaspirillum aridicola]